VESLIIRKAIETVYGRFLLKGTHPWVYLSLTMPAHRVDVNMHPTKKEVRFLDEDGVIDAIVKVLTTKLAEFGSSQKFSVHRLGGSGLAPPPLPPPRTPITSQLACSIGGSGGTPSQSHQQTPFTEVVDQRSSFQSQQTPKSTPAHKLVRTDPKEQSIMSMFRRSSMTATAHSTGEDLNADQDVDDVTDVRQGDFVEIERKSIIDDDQIEDNEHCDLTSINELRDEYKQRQNSG
jgi:DNA mismatch repair protein MLH1